MPVGHVMSADPGQMMFFLFLFCISAILMLPFASVLLSSKLRSRLGAVGVAVTAILLLIVIPSIMAAIAPQLLRTPYESFFEKDKSYYAVLAHACDQMILEHPLGTNVSAVDFNRNGEAVKFLNVPSNDPSIPEVIRHLNPSNIEISQNNISFIADVRGFSVSWMSDDQDTNLWKLIVATENSEPPQIVYTEKHR